MSVAEKIDLDRAKHEADKQSMELRLKEFKDQNLTKDSLISDLVQKRSELQESLRGKAEELHTLDNSYRGVSASLIATQAMCRELTNRLERGDF